MASRVTVLLASLGAVGALVACSSSSETAAPAAPSICAPELPSELTVSEGGRALVKLPAGLELVPGEGVVVTMLSDTEASVRVPYGAAGGLTLGTSCGREIPIAVRPLSWSRVASWTELTGAPAREYGAFWLDEANAGGIVVFGGFHYQPKQFTPANDAWRFDFATSTWTALAGDALPMTPGARVAKIPGARAVYQYGGQTGDERSASTPPSMFRLDWDETTLRATAVPELGLAYGSYTGAFLYDAKRSRWIAMCGADAATGVHCEVATFREGQGFEPLIPTGTPPEPRYGFHYVLDQENDRVVLFAGQGTGDEEAILGDTWTLELGTDPPSWRSLKAAGVAPSKRRNAAYALDVSGHRLFVWGGTPDGRVSVKGLQALSLDRGSETWSEVVPAGTVPPARTSGLAVEDPARGRILFGFGNDDLRYRDLWALDVGAPTVTSEASGARR